MCELSSCFCEGAVGSEVPAPSGEEFFVFLQLCWIFIRNVSKHLHFFFLWVAMLPVVGGSVGRFIVAQVSELGEPSASRGTIPGSVFLGQLLSDGRRSAAPPHNSKPSATSSVSHSVICYFLVVSFPAVESKNQNCVCGSHGNRKTTLERPCDEGEVKAIQ